MFEQFKYFQLYFYLFVKTKKKIMKSCLVIFIIFSMVSPNLGSFLLDMNMEMNPIDHRRGGRHERLDDFQDQQVGDDKEENKFQKSMSKWRQWIDDRMEKKGNPSLIEIIAQDFNRKYKSGQFPDSIIRKLNTRYKKAKKQQFKKISVLDVFDTPINID